VLIIMAVGFIRPRERELIMWRVDSLATSYQSGCCGGTDWAGACAYVRLTWREMKSASLYSSSSGSHLAFTGNYTHVSTTRGRENRKGSRNLTLCSFSKSRERYSSGWWGGTCR
jgi:hypothetical protein